MLEKEKHRRPAGDTGRLTKKEREKKRVREREKCGKEREKVDVRKGGR
jgi:hypothetical protein